MNSEHYNSPYAERWCRNSPLIRLFSQQNKIEKWRQLWIWLAESERELGLDTIITKEMIAELKSQQKNIDWELVRRKEAELKHDVMAHIHAYGEICPKAKGIIHLGVTSCFVQDNADLMVQRDALEHILKSLAICLQRLAKFLDKYANFPTNARTHYQAASLTTIGKRAALWADGLLDAFKTIEQVHSGLQFRGVKGAVGSRDALLQLFEGNSARVNALDESITLKADFGKAFKICGQTYPRYQDTHVIFALSLLASAANKFASDLRMLQSFGEMSEPFETEQVGSSAMPYKRNPMKCERICGIAQDLMINAMNPLLIYAHQGFERTLDDSANRRISLPDAFLAADAILSTLQNVFEGMQVHENVVTMKVRSSDAILERALMMLTCREKSEGRQAEHEKIRKMAVNRPADQGLDDALLKEFPEEIRRELYNLRDNPIKLCGQAEEQTKEFLETELNPAIAKWLTDMNASERKILDV